MKKGVLSFLLFLSLYLSVIGPFTVMMSSRPVREKMGYIPHSSVLRFFAADLKSLVSQLLVFKSTFYFGTLVDKRLNKLEVPPDFPEMYAAVAAAVKLDPYNMDAYYFGQAFLVWEAGQVKAANSMMEYGMKYRTWDFYLPFFAGFNYAYFLKDYANAAKYYRRAGELTGNELHINLAGRYLFESGETAMAVDFLRQMVSGARSDAVRKSLAPRLEALEVIRRIELARDDFRKRSGRNPSSVAELVSAGFLPDVPRDPYGGLFVIDATGRVRTTSNFISPRK